MYPPDFIKAIAAPYAHTALRMIPLGGIGEHNLAEYLAMRLDSRRHRLIQNSVFDLKMATIISQFNSIKQTRLKALAFAALSPASNAAQGLG